MNKLIGYGQDITERITREIELNKLFQLSSDMLSLVNFDGEFVKVSQGWTKALGYERKELTEKKFISFVHKDDIEKTKKEFANIKNGASTINFENRYRAKNGEYRTINWNASPDNATQLVYCIARDVTVERIAEKELKQTLHEKEILLKEVHHRVKNNMQIISSLLNLQSSVLNNDVALGLLKESKNRVNTIATVHETLYNSEDFAGVKFKEYLKNLIPYLIYSYLGNTSCVKYTIETEETFTLNTSIPLGLLVNEIISNSLKHGLKNQENDHIFISIKKTKQNEFELLIGDNGCGFDNSLVNEEIKTLGLMLIEELTKQIDGTLTKLKTEKGTTYKINFKDS